MKYFTKALWVGMQDRSDPEATDAEWARRLEAYTSELALLADRVAADVMAFFATAEVHDGQLVEYRVNQPEAMPPWDASDEDQYPVGVSLTVREESGARTWRLSYSHVRRVVVDYPSAELLFPIGGEGFGDWGYHELTAASDGFLTHEVLFATGATLLVEFRRVSVECSEAAHS